MNSFQLEERIFPDRMIHSTENQKYGMPRIDEENVFNEYKRIIISKMHVTCFKDGLHNLTGKGTTLFNDLLTKM